MKKWIVGGLFGLLFSCNPKEAKLAEKQKSAAPETNDLPAIILIDQDGKQFSARTLPGNMILIFFGASCDHCQREAQQIHENLKEFERYTLYFVSMDPFPVLLQFARTYGINDQPNIHFARADGASVFKSLGYMQTPTILIYDHNRKLVKRFDGETKVQEILKLL